MTKFFHEFIQFILMYNSFQIVYDKTRYCPGKSRILRIEYISDVYFLIFFITRLIIHISGNFCYGFRFKFTKKKTGYDIWIGIRYLLHRDQQICIQLLRLLGFDTSIAILYKYACNQATFYYLKVINKK